VIEMIRKSESGQTIIIAIILLAVGSLLVLPVLQHVFTNVNYNQRIECRTLTDYSADAGLQLATCYIYNDPAVYTASPLSENFTVNGKTVFVNAEYVGGGLFSVNSTASGGNCGSTTIRSFINLSHGAFAYALAAQADLIIDNSNVDTYPDLGEGAPVHSNSNIDISGPKFSTRKIYGDTSAVGTVTGWEDNVVGEVEEGSDNLTFPSANAVLYKTIAQEGGTHVGDLAYSGGGNYTAGPLYITGSLTVDAWTILNLDGPLYIDGDLIVNNGIILGNEHVLSEGSATITGGAYYGSEFIPVVTSIYQDITVAGPGVAETVLFAPNGNISLDNVELYGAAGGIQVIVENSFIWYSERLHGRADLPGSQLYPLTYSYD
jgi:hypothetical protein